MNLDELAFDERGLIPVIAQDAENGDVLMLAWANREALERTLERAGWSTGRARARSSGARATPAATSSTLRSSASTATPTWCSRRVHQEGAACHTGERTCFFRMLEADQD